MQQNQKKNPRQK